MRAPSRPVAVLAAGALALAGLALATVAVEAWQTHRLGPADGARAQGATVEAVRRALADELEAMGQLAATVALDPAVRAALAGGAPDRAALEALGALRLPEGVSVEAVAPDGALVAWAGPSFARARPGPPPDSLASTTVRDDAGRRALALWQPVGEGETALGAVRVVRLAEAAVPVRNRFLQDFALADLWRTRVPGPFEVRFGAVPVGAADALVGPDGRPLGRVVAGVPTERALAETLRRTTRSVAAFWVVLALGWLLAGLVSAARAATRAAEADNVRPRWLGAGGVLALALAALTAVRYALLALDVPVRWLDRTDAPAALFDPAALAFGFGGGLFRSPGDLAITAAFALAGAGAVLVFALRYAAAAAESGTRGPVRRAVGIALVGLAVPAGVAVLAHVVAQAVLNATIGYADRTGTVADGLLVASLGGLAALVGSVLALVAAVVVVAWVGVERAAAAEGGRWHGRVVPVAVALAAALGLGASRADVPLGPALALAALGCALAAVLVGRPERWVWPLTFRGTLVGALLVAPVLYGLMRGPLAERQDALLADAADAFSDARDRRVSFAVDEALAEARADDALRPALLAAVARADSVRQAGVAVDSARVPLDDLAAGLLTTSLLGSLADVAAEVRLVSPAGDTLGSFAEGTPARAGRQPDALSFDSLRAQLEATQETGFLRRSRPEPGRPGVSRTAALGAVPDSLGRPVAWVYLRALPRTARFATETPFPRVLAPAGLFGLDDEALAVAEYADGALVRNRGEAPLRLAPDVLARLDGDARTLVRTEATPDGAARTLYRRVGAGAQDVVVVRGPPEDWLDRLFVVLRLAVAGLAVGGLLFAVGLPVRRRLGLFPPPRARFRDKVLNRFLLVGLASVALTGVVGQRVVEEQAEQAVREQLRQRLVRAEAALAGSPLPNAAGAAAPLDAAAAALGTDIHLYRGATLEATSRRQLVRQRLIDSRMPGDVYRALVFEGRPFAFAEDRIGTFRYTTGYKAIADADGQISGAVAIPTLPEQAAIEAGQARMVAYLFGGLLGLLVAIVALSTLLAGQLTRPFGRLREGLRAVGAGAGEAIPVETQDEVGELVETFNAMQVQLAESRRRLAAQERELAWSEMARQVAHEIKNPLMPMKLSVQHLQRTFRPAEGDGARPEEVRFAGQFERTTGMLIDQIDTLNRIAQDFSTFARMPDTRPERLDLREVAEEAAALFEGPLADQARARLDVDPGETPLWVEADRDELRRVLVNLLTNALQAIPDGRDGQITLRTRAEPAPAQAACEHAVAEVADNGAGIPADVQPRVFQPSFSTKTSGMGLGLAISKRAVEAAGGQIAFETAEGTGTTFTVRLPLVGPVASRQWPVADGSSGAPSPERV